MLTYLKYKLTRFSKRRKKISLQYPIYYERNGVLIREDVSGQKYEIILNNQNQEQIIKKVN